MVWRKWLVRGLVFAVIGGLGAAGALFQSFTSPAHIREQIVDRLQELLPGANITLNSAQLSLLGGIHIQALRLSRRDDPDRKELANFPAAVIWHDKEQIIDRKLVIRKIEWERPHLHLIRGQDGRWNLSGDIFSAPHPEIAIPTMIVKDGSIVIEDYVPERALPALVLQISYAQVINDPLRLVKYFVKGTSTLLGPLEIQGTWDRPTNALTLSIDAPRVQIGSELKRSLAAYFPRILEHASGFDGAVHLHANLSYEPGSTHWSHVVTCQLHGGKLRHPQIPLPVEQIDASLRCLNGEVSLDKLTARLGSSARVELQGSARLDDTPAAARRSGLTPEALASQPPSPLPEQTDCEGDLKIEGLVLTEELFAGLPHNLQELNKDYAPRGTVNLTTHFEQHGGVWISNCRVKAVDVSATYKNFAYCLEHIRGDFTHNLDTKADHHRLGVNLTGLAGAQPVTVWGEVLGKGPLAHVEFIISGENIVIDEKLHKALPDGSAKVAASFSPTGLVDFDAKIHRDRKADDPNTAEWLNEYTLKFHDATLRYDIFPYPLENVHGTLVISPHSSWEFRDFEGSHKGGRIQVRGRSDPTAHADVNRLCVEIDGENVLLDQDMNLALAERKDAELFNTWKLFHPRGHIDFHAQVVSVPQRPLEVTVSATARACTIKPDCFPYELGELNGKFRYADRQVFVDEAEARHGATQMRLDSAKAVIKADGGVYLKMLHLDCKSLVLDEDLYRALQNGLRKMCDVLQLKEPFNLALDRLEVDTTGSKDRSPYIFWDGNATLDKATVQAGVAVENLTGVAACKGQYSEGGLVALNGNLNFGTAKILNQPFQEIKSQCSISPELPDTLAFKGLAAQAYGGSVYGEASVEIGSNTRYLLNLKASQIRLEEFARNNLSPSAPLNGLASAQLYLQGQGNEIQNLTGNGEIHIPSGRLYNLPAFLGLLKIIDLRPPSNSFFDEAHARFAIRGSKVAISNLDLFGNPFSLRGQGDMSLYGTDINLDFFAVWARIMDYLPPLIKEFPPLISQNLLKIKVRGRLGDLKISQEPVPIVIDPVKDLLQRTLPGRRRARNGN